MIRPRIFIPLLTIVAVLPGGGLLSGCGNNQCSADHPPFIGPLLLYFTDASGTNLLDRKTGPFYPDSVQTTVDGIVFTPEIRDAPAGQGSVLGVYPGGRKSGGNLFRIRLNARDTDTLEVLYTVRPGRCFSSIQYTVMFFNGQQVYRNLEDGSVRLVKPN
jgi:hypothetical protein